MERCIKFRAKDKFTDKWVFGDFTHSQKVTETGLEPRVMVGGYEVIEETVGQSTGLHDKNGKEIYEGDIFKLPLLHGFAMHQVRISPHHLCVEVKNTTLQDWNNLNDCWWEEFKNGIEVIGNIFDTPELLK